ncbi:MAG: RagB/SusD family nutrient uptake outer membrane protein [Bacteroidetes bacterium]|nr:MAG: RagB/SusD family nutrient uptake outer membrane protein [Bacteroidota bacterium]
MKKIFLIFIASSVVFSSCKKELDVKNPNEPTPDASANEQGIVSLAQGGVYVNGFKDLKYGDGVFGLYWSGAMGFHEMLGDVIGAEAANSFENQIGCPDKITLDNGSVILNPNNPNKWYAFHRTVNQNDQQGSNFIFYEWAYSYNTIAACNKVLAILPDVAFSGNSATKLATMKAWCHFWKGYAYGRIGSIFYAGIINDDAEGGTNGNYVTKEAIIAESNKQYDLAIADLGAASSTSDYDAIIGKLIPSFCRVGKGLPPTTAMWIRNINTLKARNLLVNKTVASMAAGDWSSLLTLTNAGLLSGDYIFTGRTTATGDFLPSSGATVSARVQSTDPGGGGFKLSERWVQEFKAGDKRFTNNVKQGSTWIGNSDRGNAFNTRYTLYNGGNGVAGTYVFANTASGQFELPLTGTYEENALMKAEALINTSQIDQGLAQVDAVRTYMGAGLAAVSGTGLTLAQAKEELRRERRIALAFRGLSFYDARRLKISEPVAAGGGRTGCVVIPTSGAVNTNATIEYGYLDYWDVPDNELAYNPPAAGSAPIKNPKQ